MSWKERRETERRVAGAERSEAPDAQPGLRRLSPGHPSAGSRPSPWQTPGTSHYLVIGLASLVLMVLMLTQLGLNTVGWFVVFVGAAGLAWRWRIAPILMLVVLAVGIKIHPEYPSGSVLRIPELLLSVAVLGFISAHYRLQSLMNHIFPLDPRRREGQPRWRIGFFSLRYRAPMVRESRAPRLVSSREVGLLVLSLPVYAMLAQILWRMFPSAWGNPGLPLPIWRAILFAWIIGLIWFGAASFLEYRRRREMTPQEAKLFLQDILWRETRREQARITRWSAWRRLRQRRRHPNDITGTD